MTTIGHQLGVRTALARPLVPPDPAPGARGEIDFGAVYDEHFDFVWRSLRRLGVEPDSLDDRLQDVFLVVHRRLDDFEARSSVRTWLFGIAHRVARDHRRTRRRKPGGEPLPVCIADPAPGPMEALETSERLRRLDAALDRLDDDKRAVLILADIEEMTGPEISRALEINENTVYSRLRAARRAFEDALKQGGEK